MEVDEVDEERRGGAWPEVDDDEEGCWTMGVPPP
jgi:hypothetical protein